MDFGTLLHVAKKNSEINKNESRYYSTKFAPPKKESKDKKLSDNIKRFLQKREDEEKKRREEDRKKLNSLMSMRDEKSKNKIKKMLKVTKSANKSVLDDINLDQTAVTAEGPEQADQDDYGYVSTEANALYQKYIEKVKDIKEDKDFAPSRPQSLRDLSGTKERVKAAITREIEEKKSHSRQRTSTTVNQTKESSNNSERAERVRTSLKNIYDPEAERLEEERKKREEQQQRSKPKKLAPPPMDFQALLKLAEVKQHEPVEILQPTVKKKEPERLLTLKEKKEWEERQRFKESRERRLREQQNEAKNETKEKVVNRMEPNGRIPKLNQTAKSTTSSNNLTPVTASSTYDKSKSGSGSSVASGSSSKVIQPKISSSSSLSDKAPLRKELTSSQNNVPLKPTKNLSTNSSPPSNVHLSSSKSSKVCAESSDRKTQSSSKNISKTTSSGNTVRSSNDNVPSRDNKTIQARPFPTPNVQKTNKPSASDVNKTRQFPPPDVQKTRQFPPPDVQKTRQFPPSDVQKTRQFPPQFSRKSDSSDRKKSQAAPKRRILDDDDDEYDSEMDDFIDDGDCEEDYSSHIKAIFGYDRSKYRYIDDDDDTAMESNFAQVQREEYLSKKIGIQEDLEDMKLEAMEKKRKMMKKRKL